MGPGEWAERQGRSGERAEQAEGAGIHSSFKVMGVKGMENGTMGNRARQPWWGPWASRGRARGE